MKPEIRNSLLLTLLLAFLFVPSLLQADPGNQYCITPPFITSGVKPNLLLMIDNSSSMYDLAYADGGQVTGSSMTRQPYYCYDETYKTNYCSGNSSRRCNGDSSCKTCSGNAAQYCNTSADCGSSQTCDTVQTCNNLYSGYFDQITFYDYDLTNLYFNPVATFPASTACDKFRDSTLCVKFNTSVTPNTVSKFTASGNYLNWLTASKFDVEKQIITGGKYVNFAGTVNGLQAESRGCVGQRFLKEALTADFVNYANGATDPNTKLGLVIAIRGPIDSANASAPSQGGQTFIEFFRGNYNKENCQAAMQIWGDGSANQNSVRTAVENCLNYSSSSSNFCSGDHSITCTTNSNCIFPGTAAVPGHCNNNAGLACNADADCGTHVIPGMCSNGAIACTDNTPCVVKTSGHCSNNGAQTCSADSECVGFWSMGSCSNQSKNCTAASDCTIPPVNGSCTTGLVGGACTTNANCDKDAVGGKCSQNAAISCSVNADCGYTTTALSGKCSAKHGSNYDSCTTNADCGTSQDPTKYGTCSAPVPSQTLNGTCTNPAPAAAVAGTCSNYHAAVTGSCTGYVPPVTYTCSGVVNTTGTCTVPAPTTAQNLCNNPAPVPSTTRDYSPCVIASQSAQVKTKVTYSHTIQTCWSYWKQGSFSNGDSQRLTNSCDDALSGWGICSADDTTVCTTDSNCSALGLGTCNHGPAAIRPGNPAYVCSNEYFGQFCTWSWNEATHTGSCSWGGTDTQRDAVFAAFCGSSLPPTVIDPTDSAASTANYESVPAMLSGIGVESQLGSPIGTLPVKLATTTAPTGLVQQFADQIRTGVMTFDQFGSGTEASSLSSAVIRIPKVCSNDETKLCAIDKDCGSGSCNNASSTQNMDGAKILYPVGTGKCATMTATPCSSDPACIAADSASRCYKGFCGTKTTSVCTTDANCTPVTQICVTNSAGDHTATDSLVNTIDTIRADAWTPFAEAFYNILGYFAQIPTGTNAGKSRIDLRLNSINTTSTVFSTSTPAAAPKDFNESLNPSEYRCQQNYVLMITDGSSTADQNSSVSSLASLYAPQAGLTAGTCSNYLGSKNLPIMAWIGKNQNIATFRTATPATPLVCSGNSAACTKDADCPSGQTCLNIPRNPRDSITSYVVYNGGSNGQTGACDSFTLLNNTATAGGTSLYVANNPAALSTSLRSVFQDVAAKAASGTAASILSNSEGSGANILQAVFYPKKIFANATSTNWIGEMQNLWYFVDPYINNSTIREDTDGDLKLNLVNDYIVRFAFDPTSDKTMVQRYVDSNGDGVAEGTVGGLIDPDDVKSIWRAGKLLWSRNISTSPRTIKTTIDGTSLIDFSSSTYPGGSVTSNAATLAPYLNVATADAPTLINWVHGADQASLRPRTVDIKDPVTNVVSTGVWRLGDIISSTPRVQSTVRLNTYNLTAPGGYSDGSYDSYTNSANYKDHGMVYVGANDGMLHAFNLGILNVQATGNLKATLTDPGNIGLGKEMWAFIPRSALPYLQYSADPTYEHLYYIDGRTVIFDASIGDTNSGECIKSTYWKCSKPRGGAGSIMVDSSNNLDSNKNIWRSIVISGMGTGGATTKTCTTGSNCVQTPLTDPNDSSKGLGYSSYFALDVTDPRNPQLLWEFSHPDLGYSTTGPAIVRLGDRDKNGRWFAVFGSGPTGPIETSTHQFQAGSNQSLKYFVVDLRTGALVKEIDTAIGNAFSGTLLGAAIDADRWDTSAVGNYQDDALYVGYVKESASGSGVFTKGGVGRIMIDPVASGIDPSDANIQSSFHWSTVLDDIGPVTTAISRLQNRNALTKALWLFFGSGRYYYRAGAVLDDYTGRRALFGIKEPCYARNGVGNHLDHASCTDAQTGAIVNQTDVNALGSLSTVSGTDGGWKIDLDPSTTAEGAERVVTDTVALTNGTVFFTSFKPTTDICGYGGNSFLWGVKYDSGGQPAANALTGKALIQLSTGEFREVDLASAFTDKLNRRMASPMTGKPPSDAPPIISSSGNKPLKKVLHIQEH